MGGIWAILALTVAVYAPALGASFHFDDFAIFADRFVTAADGWWQVFRVSQTRPLTYLTFLMNFQAGGAVPWGYHAVNLALHLGAVAAAWSVFRRLLRPPQAWFATALFALHPLQTEAVSYVFARATVLATLLCLLAWRDWLADRRWRAVAWFAAALLAKEECVAFPLFLFATDWLRDRWQRQSAAPLGAMVAASLAAGVRLLLVASQTAGSGVGVHPAGKYLLTQPKVIWEYMQLLVLPIGQNFDHDVKLWSPADWAGTAALVALVALVGVALWKRSRAAWWLGALVLLAPTSSLIPLADLMFEHRLYLPIISLAAGVGEWVTRLKRPVAAALVIALAGVSFARARVWTDDLTLWSDAAAKSPAKVRPKLQLARALAQSDPARAEALLAESQRLEPDNAAAHTQLGSLWLDQRQPDRALREFEAALRLEPRSASALSNRGTALYMLGRPEEAEGEFQRALDRDPCHFNARHNLLLLYRSQGRPDAYQRLADPPPACGFTPAQLTDLRN